MTTNLKDLHKQVTDTIIKQLEAGTAPWRKPWEGGSSIPYKLPVNATTGKKYRGINPLLLWGSTDAHGFTTHEWATFKQWSEKGEKVKKGEKGSLIVFYSTFEKQNDAGETEEIPFLKSSYVFNRCQLQSFDAAAVVVTEKPSLVDAVSAADLFVSNTQAKITHSGARAFFRPSTDEIYMPAKEAFKSVGSSTATEAYYSTLLHELSHWTGTKSRCDRTMGKRFGDNAYAMEELVAELSAAFLCADLGITDSPREDHASYLAEWLKVLKEDKRAILTAASQATKAVDYLEGLQAAEVVDVAPVKAAETIQHMPVEVIAAKQAAVQMGLNF